MGYCTSCGREVIGEGLCPDCYDSKEFDAGFMAWLWLAWRYVFKPLLPTAVVLTAFQWLGLLVGAATESELLMGAVMWLGYAVATLLFAKLFKNDIRKGFKGGLWVKVLPYFSGILVFTAVVTGWRALSGDLRDEISTLVLAILLLALAARQIVWMIRTHRSVRGELPEAVG